MVLINFEYIIKILVMIYQYICRITYKNDMIWRDLL